MVDANKQSWFAYVMHFYVDDCERPKERMSELDSELENILEEVGFSGVQHNFVLAHIADGRFSKLEQKLSSTWRERAALLQCIDKSQGFLIGRVFVVNDNQNSELTWNDVEDNFSGKLLNLWLNFVTIVERVLWRPRTSLVKYADSFARLGEYHSEMGLSNHVSINRNQNQELSANIEDLTEGYVRDTTRFQRMRMSDIFRAILNPGDKSNMIRDRIIEKFCFDSGRIYYVEGENPLLYIPERYSIGRKNIDVRNLLIAHIHAGSGSHSGHRRTYCVLSRNYFWPGMMLSVKKFVNACWICREKKAVVVKQGRLGSMTRSVSLPFQQWNLDFAGPLHFGSSIPVYFIVAICAYSHWCEAEVCSGCTAEIAVKFMENRVLSRFGIPFRVHTDRGTAFTSELFTSLLSRHGIQASLSPVDWPRANGLAERTIREFKNGLNCRTMALISEFENAVSNITFTHNTSHIADLGVSPFEVIYGMKPLFSMPFDALGSQATSLTRTVAETREWFDARRRDHYDKMVEEMNRGRKIPKLRPGIYVLHIHRQSSALSDVVVRGPYYVVGSQGQNTWTVLDEISDPNHIVWKQLHEAELQVYDYDFAIDNLPEVLRPPERRPLCAIVELAPNDTFVATKASHGETEAFLYTCVRNNPVDRSVSARRWTSRNGVFWDDITVGGVEVVPYRFIRLTHLNLKENVLSVRHLRDLDILLSRGGVVDMVG